MTNSVAQRAIPGGWAEREIVLAQRTFRLLLPHDPDRFLDQLDVNLDSQHSPDPYWATVWPTAVTMAELLLRADIEPHNAVLELGCGAGVVGLAALSRGLDVTFNDHVELAVDLALENAHRNGFRKCRGAVFDWHHNPRPIYPLIVASDILYQRDLHPALVDLLRAMLAPSGRCWIGDPGRQDVGQFLQRASASGLAVSLQNAHGEALPEPHHGHFQLLELSWRQ